MQIPVNEENIEKNVCSFLDNCICVAYDKFPLLRREYLSSAVKVFTRIPEG